MTNNYGWATHQPLIKAIMELYKPKFVLELGIGYYSTPVFLDYKTRLLSIENDLIWIETIKTDFPKANIQHFDCGFSQSTIYNQTTLEQRKQVVDYYQNLSIPILKPKLLFVDNFAGCRLPSINTIGDKFDFIIYHDSHCRGYAYHRINLTGYKSFTLYSELSNATVMIKEGVDTDLFITEVEKYIKEFLIKFSECKKMFVK